eukprot:3852431-Prymnesium_polylepis.1
MAAHFYRMHRIFDVKHRVNAAVSPCDLPASTQPPMALGPVPLRALAFIEGSASDVEGSSDE